MVSTRDQMWPFIAFSRAQRPQSGASSPSLGSIGQYASGPLVDPVTKYRKSGTATETCAPATSAEVIKTSNEQLNVLFKKVEQLCLRPVTLTSDETLDAGSRLSGPGSTRPSFDTASSGPIETGIAKEISMREIHVPDWVDYTVGRPAVWCRNLPATASTAPHHQRSLTSFGRQAEHVTMSSDVPGSLVPGTQHAFKSSVNRVRSGELFGAPGAEFGSQIGTASVPSSLRPGAGPLAAQARSVDRTLQCLILPNPAQTRELRRETRRVS